LKYASRTGIRGSEAESAIFRPILGRVRSQVNEDTRGHTRTHEDSANGRNEGKSGLP